MNFVNRLRDVGLSEYESKVLVSVVRLGAGDAKSIARDSGVPYSRIYDPLSSLIRKGWVSKEDSRPSSYRANDLEAQVSSYYRSAQQQALEAVTALQEMEGANNQTLTPSVTIKYGWESFYAALEMSILGASHLSIVIGFGNETALERLTEILSKHYVRTTVYIKQGVASRHCAMRHIASWNAELRVLPFTPPIWLCLPDKTRLLMAVPTLPEEQCSKSEVKLLDIGNFTMGAMLEKVMAVAQGESYPYANDH